MNLLSPTKECIRHSVFQSFACQGRVQPAYGIQSFVMDSQMGCDILIGHVGRQMILTSILIETRPEKWRRALERSAKTRAYAHRAIVLFPGQAAICPVTHKTAFDEHGIGLWEFWVDDHKTIRHLSGMTRQANCRIISNQAANRLLSEPPIEHKVPSLM